MQNGRDSVRSALQGGKRVLIATHVNPDGDAIGSAAALAHIVSHLRGEARLFLHEALPEALAWLPVPCPVIHDAAAALEPAGPGRDDWRPDLVAFVDCADARRAGSAFTALLSSGERRSDMLTVNIDHHASNTGYADLNWVEGEASATGELMGLLAEDAGLALGGDLGMALYLALSTDTGNFSYSNTTAECLALSSRLVRAGLDVGRFTSLYENNWNLERMHLWGRLMEEVSLHYGGAVAVCKVPLHYLTDRGLHKDSLEGFASCLRKLAGVRVGLFLREDAPGLTKISLRSMGDVNVSAVTALFGGGGHASAAGAEIEAGPDAVAEMVLTALAEHLAEHQAEHLASPLA